MNQNVKKFVQGCHDGIPIGLGYLAVSFSFGIQAIMAGLTVGQAVMMSALNLTSAGQFASLDIIAASGSYIEMALSQAIINLRYCLMSASLSQKVDREKSFLHRFLMAFGVTDEVFALSVSVKGALSPFYSYGQMAVAIPGWTLGTLLGAIAGNILPARVLSALGVALYAMFCAIIVPPAKKNKVLFWIILISMASSVIVAYAPYLMNIPAGYRVILLTVAIAAAAARLRPIGEEEK
ncbi:MAG: AzlC family ABC transporter permease [Clostridia bacterium]|nr:AzlC family ABC transporter permease [Clostridia bacterium]MBR6186768.1 AzlC family ABC transporter permease [Clostridia bacterium]